MSAPPESTHPAASDSFGSSLGLPVPGPVLDALPPTLTSRYRLTGELGRGGMGSVLRGHDPVLHRDLAVKVLLDEHCSYPELVYRFFREARLSGQLQHPGVAPVHDMGRLPDQRPYFAMKLVEGRTLAALLAERGGPAHDLPRLLKIFEQICQTLAYAHARGVIHRDLKPANVMVGAFGEVLVMDWGLAKERGGADGPAASTEPAPEAGQSQQGAVLGTPSYMPPEQARGEIDRLDERSDVFGLGAVLCEILTGLPPYRGNSGTDVLLKAAGADLEDAFTRLDACGADAELVRVAKDCLSAKQEERPRDGRAVADALTAYLAGVQERLRAAEVERAAAQARADGERKRRRLAVWLASAVLALIALGAGGGLWFVQDRAARQLQETKRQAEETRLALEKARDAGQALNEAEDYRRHGRWADAAAALERADGRLGHDGPADLRARLEQGRGELKTVADLDEIRLRSMTVKALKANDTSATAAYADRFRADCNLDLAPDRLGQATGRIAASPIKEQLTAALDAWAGGETDPTRREQLLDLLRRVDPNPWRDRLWELATKQDGPGLERLAREVNLDEAPAAFPGILASVLLLRDEKSEAGMDLLRAAQRRRPDDFWANTMLGTWLLLYRPAEKARAVGYLRAAVATRPDNALAIFNLGYALDNQGEHAEAIALLRRATALEPDFPPAEAYVASDLLTQNKPREAEAAFRALIARHPDEAVGQLGLGNALVAQDRWEDAVSALKRAVELAPDNEGAQSSLGLALFKLDRPAEAADGLRQAVRLKPDDADAEYYLGMSLVKLDKPQEAIDAFGRAGDRADAVYFRGLMFIKLGKSEEAGDAFRKAINLKPDYAEAHCGLGLALTLQAKPEDAIDSFRQSLKLQPENPEAEKGLGLALLKLDKAGEAEEAFRAALKADADDAGSYVGLGRALTGLDQPAEGLKALRKAVALAPDDAEASYYLGLSLLQQGQGIEAIPHLSKAAVANPDDPDGQFFFGYAYYQGERFGDAVGPLHKALALQPDRALAHFLLGMALTNQGRFQDGLASLERGDELGSKLADWKMPSAAMVRVCRRLIDLDEKLPAILKGDAKPDDAEEEADLGELCLKYDKKLYAASARFYVEAFAKDPTLADDADGERRFLAARAAARAAAGEGDAAGSDAGQRTRWRRQALDWLRDGLAAWRRRLEAGTATGDQVRQALGEWKGAADLAGLHDEAALAKLPADERERLRRLWSDVDELRDKVEKP